MNKFVTQSERIEFLKLFFTELLVLSFLLTKHFIKNFFNYKICKEYKWICILHGKN